MTRFDFRAASSYAAALAVAVWSSTMLLAATAVPAVSAISGSVA
jgi:hypothetical protein